MGLSGASMARAFVLSIVLSILVITPATARAESQVSGDFNGDGYDDLAIGVPLDDLELSRSRWSSERDLRLGRRTHQRRATGSGTRTARGSRVGLSGDSFGESLAVGRLQR